MVFGKFIKIPNWALLSYPGQRKYPFGLTKSYFTGNAQPGTAGGGASPVGKSNF